DDQADSRSDLYCGGDRCGGSEGYEGIISVPVLFWEFPAAGPRTAPACGDVSVFRDPQRFESPVFSFTSQFIGSDRVIGGKHSNAEQHCAISLSVVFDPRMISREKSYFPVTREC